MVRVTYAACEVKSWKQNWFNSDAIHYTAADLDGDTVPEIISASTTTVVYRHAGAYTPFTVYTSTAIGAPVPADVTGDGKIDLIIPNEGSDTLVVLPGNGNGTFNSAVVTSLTVSPARLVLGNFSGNAHVDVALVGSHYDSPLIFLQGDGTGAFTQAGTVAIGSSPFDLAKANFDGDGYDDVAVSRIGSSTLEVVFANGSGGSAATVSLDGGTSALLAAGDFDADSDIDLYSVRPSENRIDVFVNSGSRTFAVVSYDLWSLSAEAPRSIANADFDNDLDLDLAIGRPGYVDWLMRTPGGTYGPWGVGSYDQPFPWRITNNLRSLAAADFNGDGRIDLAVENEAAGHGGLFVNECDEVAVNAGVRHLITLGQATEGNVSVYSAELPRPTGTVKLSWNGGEKIVTLPPSGPLPSYALAFYTIEGLPLGFQPILAEYSGDATYPPAKNTTWITVTTDTTTTTLTGPPQWTYGQTPQFRAEITSSTGDTVTGDILYYRNGERVGIGAAGEAPVAEWNVALFPAGTHTLSAGLGYSETHPPSSDSMNVTIDKATPTLGLRFGTISREGEAAWIRADLTGPTTGGEVRLMEGGTTLDTDDPPFPSFLVSGLALGAHTLRFVCDGDANVNGASFEFVHTVLPANTVLPLVATAGANSVKLEFLRAPSATVHDVQRRVAGGSWSVLGSSSGPAFVDSTVVPGTAYQYRIEAKNGTGVIAHSNVETVYVGTFTDANLSGIKIRKLHFTELQTALNTFRTMACLPLLQIDFTGTIKAAHIVQMRYAVNEARTALGMAAIAFGSDPVARVTRIRGADLHQLRDALR